MITSIHSCFQCMMCTLPYTHTHSSTHTLTHAHALSRSPQDTDDMDYNLPQSISEFGNCIFQLLATVIFICVVQYWFVVGIVPLLCLYYMFQHYYRCVVCVVFLGGCCGGVGCHTHYMHNPHSPHTHHTLTENHTLRCNVLMQCHAAPCMHTFQRHLQV